MIMSEVGHHRKTVTDDTLSEARIRLEAEPSSAGDARRFLADATERWERPDLAEKGSLVIDELVTNAILHGLGPIDVVLRLDGSVLHIEVHDRHPRMPAPTARPPDAALSFGRGLHLVEACSIAWGSRPTTEGKCVWADVSGS